MPAGAVAGGVDVDADEEDVGFALGCADGVGAADAFFEGDVFGFGDEELGVVAFGLEGCKDLVGEVAGEGVFDEGAVWGAFAGGVEAVGGVEEDFHGLWGQLWDSGGEGREKWPSVTRWLKSGRVHYILTNNIIFAKMAEMSKYQIPYTNACIRAFGRRFSITTKEAYQYLQKYKGIGFLIEFYEIEHLQSIEDAVDDLIVFCKNNGGHLS